MKDDFKKDEILGSRIRYLYDRAMIEDLCYDDDDLPLAVAMAADEYILTLKRIADGANKFDQFVDNTADLAIGMLAIMHHWIIEPEQILSAMEKKIKRSTNDEQA